MPHAKVKVDTQDLKVGMYVCELDRPWRETPFLFQGFEIRTEEELGTLREYCRSVVVLAPENDSALSGPRGVAPHPAGLSPPIEANEHAASLLDQAMLKINNRPDARTVYAEQTTLEEEIDLVKEIFAGASDMMREVMWQAKFGKSLDLPGARDFVSRMLESILRNPDALTCFAQIKKKDEYTAMHSLRVSLLSMIFGRQLGMDPEEIEHLGLGTLLFDIGKMKIPSEILNKPGPLAADEMHLVKGHVAWSAEILGRTPEMPHAVVEIAQRHHERYDGSGYGNKLKGDSIGQYGMIAGIVDVYDALTSDRVYRPGISPYSALQKLYEWRGTNFQSSLVEKFIQCLGIYPIGSVVELNTGEIAVVAALNRLQRLKPRVVLVLQKDRSPYPNTPLTNLATRKTADGHPCEIERVLDPASVNIDPSRYLPLPGAA